MNASDMIKDLPDGSEFLDGRVLDRIGPLVSLEDCFTEIENALNYWYPLESDGATERECEARHDRLFSFYQKLRSQLEANAERQRPDGARRTP